MSNRESDHFWSYSQVDQAKYKGILVVGSGTPIKDAG